nr:hypothetical protein CFP56_37076 [Quercus suber]
MYCNCTALLYCTRFTSEGKPRSYGRISIALRPTEGSGDCDVVGCGPHRDSDFVHAEFGHCHDNHSNALDSPPSVGPSSNDSADQVLACCMCCCAFTFAAIDLGIGKHIGAVTPLSNITGILKLLYVSQIVFDSGITFGKFSVLCFYLRVFTVQSRRSKQAFWTTFALVAVFIVYKLPTQILLCNPPRKYWKPETPGHCDNDYTNFGLLLAGLLLDVITDLMILILPMPIIMGLQMDKGRKFLLFVAFFCGYATWITSLGRMGAFIAVRAHLDNPDFTWYQVPELSWSLAEISVSVLSICIPSWFYLIKRGSEHGLGALFTTGSQPSMANRALRVSSGGYTRAGSSANRSASVSSAGYQTSYPGTLKHGHFVEIQGNLASEPKTAQAFQNVEMGAVNVSKDVTVNNELSSSS